MEAPIYCPICGSSDQAPNSYCRSCGELLPDVTTRNRKRHFRTASRERKLRRIRILDVVTILLMVSAIDIVLSILRGENNFVMLSLTIVYFVLVIVFRIISLFSTRKLITGGKESESSKTNSAPDDYRAPELAEGPNADSVVPPSVVERTTELIERTQVKRGATTDPLSFSSDVSAISTNE